MKTVKFWTNRSVLLFAGDEDPVARMEAVARNAVYRYLESGRSGPPFSPFELASFLGLETVPTNDVQDARTEAKAGRLVIEFNPNRPKSRINYSVAHEIAHTFFPDCKDEVRNRSRHRELRGDDWQLETLCNIGAGELLIPAKNLPSLEDPNIGIEELVDLHTNFQVSMEALLLRMVRTANKPIWVFAASRNDPNSSAYKIDYAISSNTELGAPRSGTFLPKSSVVSDCTAIGFTARGREDWSRIGVTADIECVGIPSFPGHIYPRVVGVARLQGRFENRTKKLNHLRGDATRPRGKGRRIIAFVVNDATPRWGAGFALAIRRKWPLVQEEFIRWVESIGRLKLGTLHSFNVDEERLTFAEMVCQKGYGPSMNPRIRYGALDECLKSLAQLAADQDASVHMPMIGSGQAGGNWSVISDLIDQRLLRKGVDVTIYELPPHGRQKNEQMKLFFGESHG